MENKINNLFRKKHLILFLTLFIFRNSFSIDTWNENKYLTTNLTVKEQTEIPRNRKIKISAPAGNFYIFTINEKIKIKLKKNSKIILENIFIKTNPENFEFEEGATIEYKNCIFGYNKETKKSLKDSDVFKAKFKEIKEIDNREIYDDDFGFTCNQF